MTYRGGNPETVAMLNDMADQVRMARGLNYDVPYDDIRIEVGLEQAMAIWTLSMPWLRPDELRFEGITCVRVAKNSHFLITRVMR